MKKNFPGTVSIPPNLTLAAWLFGGFTIVVSIVYITLCSLAIHIRTNCGAGISAQSDPGSTFFRNTLLRLYFKKDDCTHSLVLPQDVTQEYTVFLLVCVTLAVSIACLILAVGFIAVLNSKYVMKYLEPVGYCYVVMVIVSLAVDLATAIHFGMDYNTFTQEVDGSSPGVSVNYIRDMYRMGALLLMAVSLKGFMAHIFNIVFISLIIFYLVEFRQKIQNEEHSIHKMGALKAYDQPRRMDEQSENSFQHFRTQPKRNDDPWQNTSESTYAPYGGPLVNPIFVNDEESPRVLNREPSRSEYTSRLASRPFSYLEDNKRQAPLKAPSPIKEPQWQREPRDPWETHAPPVPAPDYSPEAPRRLKSALKSSYM